MSFERGLQGEGLTAIHWVGILLTAMTGLVHLALGLMTLPTVLGFASVGAFGGFGFAIVLVLWGVRPWWLYVLGLPFVGTQILLWYLLNEPQTVSDISALAAVDKTVQLALLVVLTVLAIRTRQGAYETARRTSEREREETLTNRGEP